MTEVKWELSGGNDMKPDATNGGNKNLIPRVSAGTPAIGTPDDPWFGATLASANYNFMYHCNYEYDRILMGFEVIPTWATTYAHTNMIQLDDESEPPARYTCSGAGVRTYIHNRVLCYQSRIH